ncbi:apoptotic chromatin condensation inducer in the nucleus isoform X2 [Cephus cinctus]|uniref:Apoptotic chromatin condensation inducer in the nucleus isoform X2 n=1 Tax=Cephus cinctus TaxID=211228 RepID=A0AAJ7C4S5_CEPCN|nr:apoptotic chromatin condensation inducer in the nucleus isoform X2 [Cephus cinctus]
MSMRRKSERNKGKSSPEKKAEKPTRKSARRRAKRSPSSSPERDTVEDKPLNSPCTKEKANEKESTIQTRLQSKEIGDNTMDETKIASTGESSAAAEKTPEEEDGKSVWKVARADASPGEIQKLKLCRQRNTSETSENSVTRKRSNKWQESGVGEEEEVDSSNERPGPRERSSSGNRKVEEPSSSHPGQDSNEEVSARKEILSETTSANLSDAKPNIDRQGDTNEAGTAELSIDREQSPNANNETIDPNSIGGTPKEPMPQVEKTSDVEPSIVEENQSKTEQEDNLRKQSSSDDEKVEENRADSSPNSGAESESKTTTARSSPRTPSRAGRRKHRNKYHDSSNSDTPDSEDETSSERKRKESETREDKQDVEDTYKDRTSSSPEHRLDASITNNNADMETEPFDNNKEKSDMQVDKQEDMVRPEIQAPLKPVKVNLKRSFSARISVDAELKKEDNDSNVDNDSATQNKENNAVSDQSDGKCIPRKRRWGTSISTDVAPAFSVSTESLKALVPGAKPLPINEVRLSKDDNEDRERRKDRDKRHMSVDSVGDYKIREDGTQQKSEATKKSDSKMENHIARRKISIVKDAPLTKSPSPPACIPTSILLIKNLVRPFTLNQIKELLSRTGTIIENGFWMDRIKSKCFVEYANEDQAFETRQALHGISWPVSNPKRLHVEYANKEDMEAARESSKDQPLSRKTEPLQSADTWQQDWNRDEKTNANTKVMVVREWDLGKEDGQQHLKEKEREKKEAEKKRRQRSRSPTLEAHLPAPARKFKKKEDDPPPAKLLDDLFRKTKATPCIYWLPLTNEQIVVKEEMRRQHMAEHARRLEEMRRVERNRDGGRRRRSPRK